MRAGGLSEDFSIPRHGETQDWVRERNGVSKGLSVAAAMCWGNAPGAAAVLDSHRICTGTELCLYMELAFLFIMSFKHFAVYS